jgi:hypothetical protein
MRKDIAHKLFGIIAVVGISAITFGGLCGV